MRNLWKKEQFRQIDKPHQSIRPIPSNGLVINVWTDRHGQDHVITDMSTRHIFNSLNMIWNHTQPVKTRTNFKVYRLGARFRNGQYMRGVIRALLNELMTRDPKQYERELKIMRDYIESKKFDSINELSENAKWLEQE